MHKVVFTVSYNSYTLKNNTYTHSTQMLPWVCLKICRIFPIEQFLCVHFSIFLDHIMGNTLH